MVVSLKANRKRIVAFIILAAVVAAACLFLWQGKGDGEESAAAPGGTNEERVAFLQSFGWQVAEEPAETREVMIPETFSDVYMTYNAMQKAQGFDLKPFAGKVCTQYRYRIENYPNVDEVYATLLVCGEEIIGGDVVCAEVEGFMHGFAKDSAHYGQTDSGAGTGKTGKSGKNDKSGGEDSAAPESSEGSADSNGPESDSSESGDETAHAQSTAALPEEGDYPTD